jgi:hypothetical protein
MFDPSEEYSLSTPDTYASFVGHSVKERQIRTSFRLFSRSADDIHRNKDQHDERTHRKMQPRTDTTETSLWDRWTQRSQDISHPSP